MEDEPKSVDAIPPKDDLGGQGLEKWKFEQDLKLRTRQMEEDVRLRREELDAKRNESSKVVWSSPLLVAVIGLMATVLAGTVQSCFQSQANRDLERQRFESAIVQKAIETKNSDEAAKRLKFYSDLGLITINEERLAGYIGRPDTIPLQPLSGLAGDQFQGVERKAAKLSIGSGPVKRFTDIRDLILSLRMDKEMISNYNSRKDMENLERTDEEQKNVQVNAFLYAASGESSKDFRLIIGRAPGAKPEMYMTAVVSGLPTKDNRTFSVLKTVRDIFKTYLGENQPGLAYEFFEPPIPVEVEGSLLFNFMHADGVKSGPSSLKDKIPTAWELRPVTKLSFDRQ